MKTSICKGCKAKIIWIKTVAGKSIPCDPDEVVYWEYPGAKGKIVTPNGEVISCIFTGDPDTASGIGYVPHWATCREAGRFRK